MVKYYTGIGSRKTPPEIKEKMVEVAEKLAEKGYVLRSGGADGADAAFEEGCDNVSGEKEIYLPWPGFNEHPSQYQRPPLKAFEIASEVHPVWNSLTQGARRLHARNCQQILGEKVDGPISEFVICWTPDGKDAGGTATALKLARQNNIPIYNMGSGDFVFDSLLSDCSIEHEEVVDYSFNEYQKDAVATAIYPEKAAVLYPSLKLAGEAGEVAEKVGKLLRGDWGDDIDLTNLSDELKQMFVKELGDVLWYVAALSRDLGVSMQDVATTNIAKLRKRKEQGTLKGSGDDR